MRVLVDFEIGKMVRSIRKDLWILILMLFMMLGLSHRCTALPVWPVTFDPNGMPVNEDRIGYENDAYTEFMDFAPAPGIIDYQIDGNWVDFPHRLNTKQYQPHTVNIHFDANSLTMSRNLVLSLRTDAPTDQTLGVYFDNHPIHRMHGELIQPGMGAFQTYTFWLGSIAPGAHRITIANETDPNSTYGIFFDYVKLEAAPRNTIVIPDDFLTITQGIEAADPGDTIIVKKGTYLENQIELKSGLTLRSRSDTDPNEIDPNAAIIDGGGQNILFGAYQASIKGFTIQNAGLTVTTDAGLGIITSRDLMSLSNNIITACAIGIYSGGQDLHFENNTIVRDGCGLYIRKYDPNLPVPSVACRNNIFSDCDCAIYVFTDSNSNYGIDPNRVDEVIQAFGFNNINCTFDSNLNLTGFSSGNTHNPPYFVDPNAGDYHLLSYSPCIDAGDPNSDFSGEPQPNGGRINQGAYGNTAQARMSLDSDGDGVNDAIEGPQYWQSNKRAAFHSETGQGDILIWLVADPNSPLSLAEVSALDPNAAEISSYDLPNAHFLFGLWKFKVNGMTLGEKVEVYIDLPQTFSDIQSYHAFHPNTGWHAIPYQPDSSYYCPVPRIILELSDHDASDLDQAEDGSLYHIGGIALSMNLREGFDFSTCFIGNLESVK